MARAVCDLALAYCAPIYWHDITASWPRVVRGGTCFFLKFEKGVIGVTANHVLTEFLDTARSTASLACQIGDRAFDFASAVIDSDAELDLATFNVTEELITSLEKWPADCRRQQWPPDPPKAGDNLVLIGFPEAARLLEDKRIIQFGVYAGLCIAEDVSDRDVLVVQDRRRDRSVPFAPMPPPRYNMSGCSGGLGVRIVDQNRILRSFPAGVIYKGPGTNCKGDFVESEMVQLRRIHYVLPNGTLDRSSLPPRLPGLTP
jgi:hypothetical protein